MVYFFTGLKDLLLAALLYIVSRYTVDTVDDLFICNAHNFAVRHKKYEKQTLKEQSHKKVYKFLAWDSSFSLN
jgi:hypothetical protein